MRLPISDQQQPRLYLALFSHNTSVTDKRHMRPKTPYSMAVVRQKYISPVLTYEVANSHLSKAT